MFPLFSYANNSQVTNLNIYSFKEFKFSQEQQEALTTAKFPYLILLTPLVPTNSKKSKCRAQPYCEWIKLPQNSDFSNSNQRLCGPRGLALLPKTGYVIMIFRLCLSRLSS
ncbi:uncharacterized protein LOC130989079 [Salvia miltiorrhiza]|uniref:uncharacterized protein LOC130989079 n=1 Tax=Salvia miltiorrhiza TaxID=226208 RepID=UPI0025AD2558|nr:uncharacterized protein LOC130989079 [Salvia miltiorrhiza]